MAVTAETTTDARARLLAGMPVTERTVDLAGIRTACLEGGAGRPVVLLHEPGSFAAQWVHVLPRLVARRRVIAPDLPGHGASRLDAEAVDGRRMLEWLGALIEQTCDEPPTVVGHLGSGAFALRFAAVDPRRVGSLVLVDSFGLAPFRPAPAFALALFRYVARPTSKTHDALMSRCTVDFDGVRTRLGERWEPFQAYTLEGARSPDGKRALRVMMRELAVPTIEPAVLASIDVPVTLIWGRRDPVNRLRVAEAASRRYGWALHVIDDAADDPPLESPDRFLDALEAALA